MLWELITWTIECQLTDLFVYITYFAEIFKMLLCKVVDVNLSRDSKISWSYWGIPPLMVDNSAAEVKLVMLILWSLRLYGRVINDCDDPAAKPPLHRSVQVWLFLTWWLFFTFSAHNWHGLHSEQWTSLCVLQSWQVYGVHWHLFTKGIYSPVW